MRILKAFLKRNSTRLAVSALAVPLTLSGCDIGKNRSHTELTGYDLITGYYSSLPQTISFAAKVGSESTERQKNGTIAQMPDFLKLVMANPTGLSFDDPIGGYGSLRARTDTKTGIPTMINDKLGTFGASSSAAADISGCRLTQELVNSGTFNQIPSVIGDVKARGQITLTYTLHYSLVGTDAACDPVRARFKSCYVDDVNCAADVNSIFYPGFVYEMFDPFVNSGTITPDEIGSFHQISYQARYE